MPSCMSLPAQARKVFGVWMSGAPDAKIRSPREACLAARCRLQANRYIRNYGSSENGSYPARRNLQKTELSWQCVVQKLHFSAKWRSIRRKCRKRGTISLFLFGHCVLRSFVFIHIPASNVLFNIFFSSSARVWPRRG